MKSRLSFFLLLVLVLAMFSLVKLTHAQMSSFILDWWTVDGGGGTSNNGGYILSGTIGQPEAGTVATGGGFTLAGGFWHGGEAIIAQIKTYLPLTVK
jgi:hypothetical protein